MKDFKLMLAPMEDITGSALRTICHKYGADMTFSEMVRVAALSKKNGSTWKKIEPMDATPVILQLIGAKEEHYERFLSLFKPFEGFGGFNINIGCPSPDVIKLGQGCAMMRRISKTARIAGMISARGYPVSVKMRLGMNQSDKDYKIYLKLIEAIDADFFVVHARHGAETYDAPADFGVYDECVATGKNIVANGDITTREQLDALRKAGLKGAMIGRAAVNDPGIFGRLLGIKTPYAKDVIDEFIALSTEYGETPKYRNNVLRHTGSMPMVSNWESPIRK